MGTSCISNKHANEKENLRPPQNSARQLEIALNPKISSKSTSRDNDTAHRNSPPSETKSSEVGGKQAAGGPKPSCSLCQEGFDGQARLPVMLCEQEHTICRACKDMLLATPVPRYRVCPWCKAPILDQFVRPNQQLALTLGCQ
jgi:hypothetical protein